MLLPFSLSVTSTQVEYLQESLGAYPFAKTLGLGGSDWLRKMIQLITVVKSFIGEGR